MSHITFGRREKLRRIQRRKSTYFEGDDATTQLPKLFVECIQFIEKHGLDCEGILRCSGRVIETKTITLLLENGDTNLGQVDVHAVSSTLKAFLSESPASILPQDRYVLFLRIAEDDDPANVTHLKELIGNMPLSNQRVLHRLMLFIQKVIDHGEQNKMTAQSLSIIFGPILLRTLDKQSAPQQFSDNSSLIKLAHKIIVNHEFLFKGLGLHQAYCGTPQPHRHNRIHHEVTQLLYGKPDTVKDKIKARIVMQFSLYCEPSIQGTQSLFIKWTLGLASGGNTERVLCSNPTTVSWDEPTAFECSLKYIKKTQQYEEKNIAISVKEVTEKGTKTLGSALCNLADFMESEISSNPSKVFSHTYDMTSKTHKGLKLTVRGQSECLQVNSKLLVKNGTSIVLETDDEITLSSDSSFETEDEEFFDLPNDDAAKKAAEASPDRPSLQRTPSSSLKRTPSSHRLVPREQYSTLPIRPKPKLSTNNGSGFVAPYEGSSPPRETLKTNEDVLEKMGLMLFEKEKLIDQLRKQIEQLSNDNIDNSPDNEVFGVRCDLLQNEIYNPVSLSYTYGQHGCFTNTASKLILNISKTKILFGTSQENSKILDRICSSLRDSYDKADTPTKLMYWLSTACGLMHYVYDSVYENQNNSGDVHFFGARAFGEKICLKAGFEGVVPFLAKIQQLAKDGYESILNTTCKHLETLLLNIFFGRGITTSLRSPKLGKQNTPEVGSDIFAMQTTLEKLIDLLLEHKIFPLLAGDLILQVLDFVDEATFNIVVQQKKIFSSDGVRLRLGSVQLEQWLKDSHAEVWLSSRKVTVLKYVQETSNVILTEKDKFESIDYIRSNFKYLNLKQILVLVENFVMDENSKKTTPSSVIKNITNALKSSSDKHAHVSLRGAMTSHMSK